MTRKLAISQIIENASKMKTDQERIQYLQMSDNSVLRQILQYGLDPRVKWNLPAGDPPYKKTDFLDQEGMLYMEARRLYLFLEGGNPDIKKIKREQMFIGLLESIHPQDAELLCMIKDKKLPKNITKEIVNSAFPGLIEDEQVS
jgi:hypothetical protein